MDLNKLTQKSQEAVAAAQELAVTRQHQEVDAEHLLSALLQQEGGLVPRLLEKMDIDANAVRQRSKRSSIAAQGLRAAPPRAASSTSPSG